MPLFAGGLKKIRQNLLEVQEGRVPKLAKIGVLTSEQLQAANAKRAQLELEPIEAVIVFRGKHLYQSRCGRDGYTIDEILTVIERAMHESSIVAESVSTVLVNPEPKRLNGRVVHDEVVFECTQRYPVPELFSAIPRGDGRKVSKSK